ncbi:MAG TPA: tetratricopeptide repeat protein [Dehalococcoidia bacterium]|nr:tetratricopeptide repeat protein [Dehalococcoidia bacterium]
MVFQAEDRAKVKKQQAEVAIQMALQGRWAEAVQLNRAIVESFPADVDAFNRLGKALTELGRYGEARDSYNRALDNDPLNSIARKNLDRLATLGEQAPPPLASQKLSPQMFIEEMGKTGVTTLLRPNMPVAARMTAGDQVSLQRANSHLAVQTLTGEQVGEVEPKLGQRLLKLMDAGNEYVAAIQALDGTQVKVFIRETFQHASQTGKLSFPPTVIEQFRPYTKGRLVRSDGDDDLYFEESDESEDWDAGGEKEERESTMFDLAEDADVAIDMSDEAEDE